MPILSREEAKLFLQIESSDISKDSIIDALLAPAEDKGFAITKNYFHIRNQFIQNYQVSFTAATRKITNLSGDFIQTGLSPNRFQAGLYIHAEGSVLNDGVKLISSVTATELVVSSDDTLFNEDAGALVKISLMKIPEGFKQAIADYIGYLINKRTNVKSESIGKYSVTYTSDEEAAKNIFRPWMRITAV